jgi:4-hydroxythreonine-4-phosphate dehydrogenase
MAVTMGDPSGIGPEIIARMWQRRPGQRDWIAIGNAAVMERAMAQVGEAGRVRRIDSIAEAAGSPDALTVLEASPLDTLPPIGVVSATSGSAAYAAIIAAIDLARAGQVRGVVTAPIHKEALAAAGLAYPGHTEILADEAGVPDVAMMLANDEIRTVLVTIHCSLAEAIRRGDHAAQMRAMRLAHRAGLALPCRRGRPFRRRGNSRDPPGHRGGAGRGDRRIRAVAGGHGVHAGAAGPVRRGRGAVPRSGPHPGQVHGP